MVGGQYKGKQTAGKGGSSREQKINRIKENFETLMRSGIKENCETTRSQIEEIFSNFDTRSDRRTLFTCE